jgi:betaine reductase
MTIFFTRLADRHRREHEKDSKKEERMFKGKKVIVVGERDGVPGPAIAQCVLAAGGEIAFMTTECFV